MKQKTFKDYYLLYASNSNKRKGKILKTPLVEFFSEAVNLQKLSRSNYVSSITKTAFEKAKDILEKIRFRKKTQNTLSFAVSSAAEKKNYIVRIAFEETIPKTLKGLFTSDCLLDCNCPAFRNQGMQYKLSTVDGALVPQTIPDDVWGPRHGNRNYICKHIYALIAKLKITKFKSTKTFLNSLKEKKK